MTGCGCPCGACKFLRRKCVRGCVFAPYFSDEQGATHFAAIHKVFGASNVSKLLAHLPLTHRSQAALTISYEAQARLHDPIYGCVSHIFALQHQVMNLQAQLAYLKERAAQSFVNASATENPNENYLAKPTTAFPDHDLQDWFLHTENYSNMGMGPQVFPPNYYVSSSSTSTTTDLMNMDQNPYDQNSGTLQEESISFSSFDDTNTCNSMSYDVMQPSTKHYWGFHQVLDDLQSVPFGFTTPSAS